MRKLQRGAVTARILTLAISLLALWAWAIPSHAQNGGNERHQIMDALRFDFYRNTRLAEENPKGIKFVVGHYKTAGDWACVRVTPTIDGKEIADPRWAILQRRGGRWAQINYVGAIAKNDADALDALDFAPGTSAKVKAAFPSIPKTILP
jgi:hypothetical protein